MSELKIKDGTGSGRTAGVNEANRLETEAITITELENRSETEEGAYYLASDFIALTTTASFNGVLYFKNTLEQEIHIAYIRTCGDMVQEWKLIKNPTTGTLISDANAGLSNNINFSSNKTLTADVYSASGDGKTITNGSQIAQLINDVGHSNTPLEGALILKNGDSVALTCKPAAAGDVCATVLVYIEEPH